MKTVINITDKRNCCGCSACASICPKSCITMVPDETGFLYPEVDQSKCIDCNACEKVCPILASPTLSAKTSVVAVQSHDAGKRNKSTAGGVFYALASWVIEHGGYVCGVGYSEDAVVQHKVVSTKQELDDLLGSKYVQSKLGDTFVKIAQLLKDDNTVLFVGTPCQVAGLNKYVAHLKTGCLYTVDLICYGVPSPMIYKKWIDYIQTKYKKSVSRVLFRDKSFGYAAPNVRVVFKDGSIVEQTLAVKSYMKLFMGELSVRPVCAACKFKSVEKCSDLTLGDCWHIGEFNQEMDDNMGTTNVFIHSEKGQNLFNRISGVVKCIAIDADQAVKLDGKKMLTCVSEHPRRNEFFCDAQAMPYSELIHKYVPDTMRDYIVALAKKALKKLPGFQKILKSVRK